MVTNYTGTGIDAPAAGSRPGRTGRCGSPTSGNNSIGRITTAGVVTNYTGTGIDDPTAITAGPDGALWFTNHGNNSIGRITTAGVVTNYTGTGIDGPPGITAGPDGALWFTNAVATTRSGGSPPPGWSPTTPAPASTTRTGSRPGPTGRCGSPTPGNNSIGRITTAGVVTNYTGTGIERSRTGSRPGRTGRCGSPTRQQLDRADHDRREWSPTTPAPASTTRTAITAGPDGALWFTNAGNNSIGRITTAGVVTNYTGTGIIDPEGITAGPDGALWFTNVWQQLDRADHHRRTSSATYPLAIGTASLPDAPIGQAYAQQLAATGGTTPYTWSVASGTLPAGLTLDPTTGIISGTPTGVGSADFTVEVTDTTTPTVMTATMALSINTTLTFSIETAPTQTGGVTVQVAVDYCPFNSSGGFAYSWTLDSSPLSDKCSFVLPLSVGHHNIGLSVTDASGTSTTIEDFSVSPVAGFTYVVEPVPAGGSNSSAYVDFDACGESGGISNYAWAVDNEASQSSGTSCAVTVQIPSGDHSVTLDATGTDGNVVTVFEPLFVYPIVEQPTGSCVWFSVLANACWREGINDVLNPDVRGADYVVVSVGASAGVASGSVSDIITCDGSVYGSVSGGVSISTPYPTAVLAYGYVGSPSADVPVPSNAEIDSYVAGDEGSFGVNLGIFGTSDTFSSSAPGDGVEFDLGDTGIGVTASLSFGTQLYPPQSSAPTCVGGVTAQPFYQGLINTVQASGSGLPRSTCPQLRVEGLRSLEQG